MRVAILGGAFNPPHWGHLTVAQQILDFCQIDQVWLMPTFCYDPAFNKQLASFSKRLAMTSFFKQPKIKVSDFEKTISGISHTYKVMSSLQKKFQKVDFSFVMGSDNLRHFSKWACYQKILKKWKIYVFPREKVIKKFLDYRMEVVKSPLLVTTPISSTLVRQTILQQKPLDHLLPPSVVEYIKEEGLFT
jgi:nicotinate-nucleotide adenylyltransferase